jgi:hypothetical protein
VPDGNLTQSGMLELPEENLPVAELPDRQACWALLERLSASAQLRRSARLQELLFFLVKRSLDEGCERLHEQEIGARIFNRPDSYDTSVDNIVRTNVSDLRRRIEAYFNSEGAGEKLLVEVPRGSYIPVFRYRAVEPEVSASTPSEAQQIPAESAIPVPQTTPSAPKAPWNTVAAVSAGVLILGLAATCIFFWNQYRSLRQSVYAWQYRPSVAALWNGILSANPSTDVVMSDAGIGLTEALSRQTFTLDQYLARSYAEQLQTQHNSPDMHAALNRILSWNLASPDEFALAHRILALDPLGKQLHLYNARNYMPELIKHDNVILIGARKTNPWDELFDNQMNFITEFDSPRVVNRAPAAGEQAVYPQTGSVGYCVIAYLPNPDRNGVVLLIDGTNAEATEAAGDFLLSEDQLSAFKRMLHVTELPYFQVLLKVSSVRGTPLTTTIQAYRAGQH